MRPDRSAVILDRYPVWLDAMARLLEGIGIEVAGKATGSGEALRLVEEHHPDLLIAGLDLAGAGQVV